MCGVAGIAGAFEHAELAASLAALHHRGPDSSGLFVDQPSGIGLAHARLSILDLSPLGNQPMASADGSAVLAYNGEIYNFRELRADLEARGRRFRSQTDSEVLLQMYEAHRDDVAGMLRQLNGIFAFALWDAQRGALLLAKDALGVKPLYYSDFGERCVFASELKALQPLLPPLDELDLVAVDRYLSFLWCPGERTPSKYVKKVAPGEMLWIVDGRIAARSTWVRRPDITRPTGMTPEEAITGTTDHLRRAVHRQLVSDVGVGAFLSGGLDSSSIVAFALEELPQIRCFTVRTLSGGDDGFSDDLPYARRVASHLGVPLDIVDVDARDMANDVEAMVAQLDEPLADPAALNVLYISRLARRAGIKVLLSGAGGDDLFTGYRRHRAEAQLGFLQHLPQGLRTGAAHLAARLDQTRPGTRRVRKLLSSLAMESDARLVEYFRWIDRPDLFALYTPEFRAALNGTRAEDPLFEFLESLPDSLAPLDRLLALEQRFFLADHNLIYTDKMSMAVGVEVRVPFLDLELVEFAARIPWRLKQKGACGKWVLKRAMEPYLPRDVIYRPKTGFGAPVRRWMRGELRDMVGDLLSPSNLGRRGIFEPRAVQALIAANDGGRVDAAYTLLSMLCIELWCRRFMSPQGAVPRTGDPPFIAGASDSPAGTESARYV